MERISGATQVRVIAILRGLLPEFALETMAVLNAHGFGEIEIPLNGRGARESLEVLANNRVPGVRLGAGTVKTAADIEFCEAQDLDFTLSPHWDSQLADTRLEWIPGVMTPSEWLAAEAAGCSWVKLFPASLVGTDGYKAIRAVTDPGVKCVAVGGITLANARVWAGAGVDGLGLGSDLFQMGDTPDQTESKAQRWSELLKQL